MGMKHIEYETLSEDEAMERKRQAFDGCWLRGGWAGRTI